MRELVRGEGDILWGLLWREGPAEWLKFAAPITVLVFAQAGLYRQRERRPGAGRLLASLIVVALIVLAFGFGTDYDFTTSGLIPTAVVMSALTIGLFRAAYESASLEVLRAAGDPPAGRARGRGREPRPASGRARRRSGRPRVQVVGAVAREGMAGLRRLGSPRRAWRPCSRTCGPTR